MRVRKELMYMSLAACTLGRVFQKGTVVHVTYSLVEMDGQLALEKIDCLYQRFCCYDGLVLIMGLVIIICSVVMV